MRYSPTMKKRSLAAAVFAAIMTLTASPAQASATADQSIGATPPYDSYSWLHSSQGLGQSITAGLSGPLTSITVFLKDGGSATAGITVTVKAAAAGLPTGAALATQTIPDSDVPLSVGAVSVSFTSPPTITAGLQYAILLTTTASSSGNQHYEWYYKTSTVYTGGTGLDDRGVGGAWRVLSGDYSLITYVTLASSSPATPATPSNGSGSQSVAPQSVNVDIGLDAGEIPASWSGETTIGSWLSLPAPSEVSGTGDNAGKKFLGVATSEDFPVEIAQRQIDNGWGAYEIYSDDGSLLSVFIPAGYSVHVTAAPRVFAIWSTATPPAVGGQVTN